MSEPARGPRVVVAHAEKALREAAVTAVRTAGYEAIGVGDGESALALLLSQPAPAALVVDVALPGLVGYELCDEIRERRLGTKVVLVASVYSKTAYKRRPSTLYGADAYVEQHHIIDMLAPRLAELVPAPLPPSPIDVHHRFSLSPAQEREAAAIKEAGEARLARHDTGHQEAVARAEQLARLIVADLMLYSGTEVESWLAGSSPPESLTERPPPARLLADLDEARRMFRVGVPRDVLGGRDFVGEALLELVGRRGKGPHG
jgi:CheY-like chemotaxis protein